MSSGVFSICWRGKKYIQSFSWKLWKEVIEKYMLHIKVAIQRHELLSYYSRRYLKSLCANVFIREEYKKNSIL
jgi:hypothetical protein